MKLSAHDWQLEVDPRLGGAILGLTWQGQDVLRKTRAGASSPLDTACFPMVPYANRIADGHFSYGGKQYRVARNFGDHPHSLHGASWQSPWSVENISEDEITLVHVHDGGPAWPWPYRATQRFLLATDRFDLTLSVTNTASEDAPAGLGLHPYFPCDRATRLTAHAAAVMLSNSEMLPTLAAAPDHFGDWSQGEAVCRETWIDNAYCKWDGKARIGSSAFSMGLQVTGADAFHLFRPPAENYFCFEPVDHLPDAINQGAMPDLAPGLTKALKMRLSIQ